MKKNFVVIAGFLACCAGVAQATPLTAPIPGIVSTGAGLAEGATDLNFLLIDGPAGVPVGFSPKVVKTTVTYGGAVTTAFPFADAWVPNDPNSQWLGIQDSYAPPTRYAYGPSDPAGWYTYRLTFSLPSDYAAQHATISGSWAADNIGELYLNEALQPSIYTPPAGGGVWGANTHSCAAADLQCFKAMHAFEITSGFVMGTNYLDFRVYNSTGEYGNPSGFRASFPSASYGVPEPSTFALWAGGLAAVAFLRRRKIV